MTLYILLEAQSRAINVFDSESAGQQGLRAAALEWAKKEVGENHLQLEALDTHKPLAEFEDGLLLRHEDANRITVYRKRTQLIAAGWLSAESKQVEIVPCHSFALVASAAASISAPEQLRQCQRQLIQTQQELTAIYAELEALAARYQLQRSELGAARKKLGDAEARAEQLEAYAGVKTVRPSPSNEAGQRGLTINVLQELCSVLQARGLKQ